MSATKRVIYNISTEVIERFNAVYEPRQRSRMIEEFMIEKLREARAVEAARAIAEDAEAAREHAELSEWVDAQSAHTLTTF